MKLTFGAVFTTLYFHCNLNNGVNKREWMFLASSPTLVYCLWIRQELTLEWGTWKALQSGRLWPFANIRLGSKGLPERNTQAY
jgi:hypothetical protein